MSSGLTLQEALAEMQLTGAKTTGITATIAQTLANWGLNASMAVILAATLVFIAAIALLAVGIYAVVKAIQYFQANSPEGKLKAA
jgi:hypothetical protein